ncbi:MAG TPA: hypothetical protein VEH79_04785 [Gaiellaceae bacterium]|nr:hypothetical protein [Gaiellaceae bacterium]
MNARRLALLAAAATAAAATAFVAYAAAATSSSQASMPNMVMSHATESQTVVSQVLARQLAAGRLATAKYATSLAAAKQDGYFIITRDIPDMGWHFLNPKVTKFDIRKPPILVYNRRGSQWQLVAFEWVFPKKPATPPLPGATYGTFGAACHYKDGTFVFKASQDECAPKSPQTGAAFGFWHPDFVTLHVWLWYPNPSGLYSGMNPLMHPFNS